MSELVFEFPQEKNQPSPLTVPEAIQGLNLLQNEFDVFWVPSKDEALSEYVTQGDSARVALTAFTGSIGECFFYQPLFQKFNHGKPVRLAVDGRYHLQANQECDPSWIQIDALDLEPMLAPHLLDSLKTLPKKTRVACVPLRMSLSEYSALEKAVQDYGLVLVALSDRVFVQALALPGFTSQHPIQSLSVHHTGRSPERILNQLHEQVSQHVATDSTLIVTCAADDAAFVLNARGYHLPQSSAVLARLYSVRGHLAVVLPSPTAGIDFAVDLKGFGNTQVTVIRNDQTAIRKWIRDRHADSPLRAVAYHSGTMNAGIKLELDSVLPEAQHFGDFYGLRDMRRKKTPEEQDALRDSFLRSSKAIAETLREAKKNSEHQKFSELDLSRLIQKNYARHGAFALSFKPISGAGPNSAIVHYNRPKNDVFFEPGQIALLDSGAYYESGFATDCTRGFFVRGAGQPQAWQKEIYTVTLKAAISVFLQPIPRQWHGRDVDAFVRKHIQEHGYDYKHGTGHGIGISVHEEGIRFAPLSTFGQTDYACVSVEPGIYWDGKGGVRIENVVLLIPDGADHYRYDNLVKVGFDWDLVDIDRLTPQEKTYLKAYEQACSDLGTALMACPL